MIEHNHRRGAEAKDSKGPHGVVQSRVPRVEAPLDGRDPVVQPLHPDGGVQDAEARHEHRLVQGELVHFPGEQGERAISLGIAVRVGQPDCRVLDDKVGGKLYAPDGGEQARVGEPGKEAPDRLCHGAAEDAEPLAEVHVHGRAEQQVLGVSGRPSGRVEGEEAHPHAAVDAVGVPHEDVLLAVEETIRAKGDQPAENLPAVQGEPAGLARLLEATEVGEHGHQEVKPNHRKQDGHVERLEDVQRDQAPRSDLVGPDDRGRQKFRR